MKRVLSTGLVIVVLSLTALASQVAVLDQAGYTVVVSTPVERIASVYGIGTYYVYALGGADRLVLAYYIGVKTAASASAVMQRCEPRLTDLLSFGDPNVEELLASGAQLVLADAAQHSAVAEQLRELGLPVALYSAESPDALKQAVRITAGFLGSEARQQAESFVADYDRIVSGVAVDLTDWADEERARVLFIGSSSTKAISGDMYQDALIRAAGGRSVTADLIGSWNEVNLEQVLRWDPDVIIIPPYGPIQPADLMEDADWQAVRAVQTGRVYRMPRLIAPMDTPVPESMLGILWLAETLYPGAITADLADEVARFYAAYYQVALTDAEIAVIASP